MAENGKIRGKIRTSGRVDPSLTANPMNFNYTASMPVSDFHHSPFIPPANISSVNHMCVEVNPFLSPPAELAEGEELSNLGQKYHVSIFVSDAVSVVIQRQSR